MEDSDEDILSLARDLGPSEPPREPQDAINNPPRNESLPEATHQMSDQPANPSTSPTPTLHLEEAESLPVNPQTPAPAAYHLLFSNHLTAFPEHFSSTLTIAPSSLST